MGVTPTATTCATAFCEEVATCEFGIDKVPCCESCYHETGLLLAAIRKEAAEQDAENERRRID